VNRNDIVQELASHCRQSHIAALWVVAYLTHDLDPYVLQEALEGAKEVRAAWAEERGDHLKAYRERWGRLPDRS